MEKYKVNLNIDVYVEAESFNDAVEKAVDKVKLDSPTPCRVARLTKGENKNEHKERYSNNSQH